VTRKIAERLGGSTLKSAYGQNVKRLTPSDLDLLGHVWFAFRLEVVAPTSDDRPPAVV
jgi:hypothetical protein